MSTSQATERAYVELRRRIMSWDLPPGARLREVELADELDMSRTPVRDAIARLRADGLVRARGQRGNEVPTWTRRDLDESYRMRANVEAWTARVAAERIENSELVALHQLADQMSELAAQPDERDLDRIAELNIEFHRRISGSVGSERMTQMRSSVVHMPFLYKVFRTFTPQQIVLTTDEHHTILMALEARDADWAESITRAHILAALSSLLGPHGIFELEQGDEPA